MPPHNGNRQAPIKDPDIQRAMMAHQPVVPDPFGPLPGMPTPTQTVQGVHNQAGKVVQFFTTGGLTCFESECMKMACRLATASAGAASLTECEINEPIADNERPPRAERVEALPRSRRGTVPGQPSSRSRC